MTNRCLDCATLQAQAKSLAQINEELVAWAARDKATYQEVLYHMIVRRDRTIQKLKDRLKANGLSPLRGEQDEGARRVHTTIDPGLVPIPLGASMEPDGEVNGGGDC